MKGRDFIEKIDSLRCCIKMFNISISSIDEGKLALTETQQVEIRDYLNDYRRMLLENEIN